MCESRSGCLWLRRCSAFREASLIGQHYTGKSVTAGGRQIQQNKRKTTMIQWPVRFVNKRGEHIISALEKHDSKFR